MQVRNKLNGSITSAPTNDNAIRAMIRLGILEVVGNDPGDMVRAQNGAMFPVGEPAPEPKWFVTKIQFGVNPDPLPAIVFQVGTHTQEQFTGDPKNLKYAFGKREVPPAIAKEYAELYDEFYMGLDTVNVSDLWAALTSRRKQGRK